MLLLITGHISAMVFADVRPAPMNAVQVSSWAGLADAVATAPSGVATIIELTSDIPSVGHSAIAITSGRDITITGTGNGYALHQATTNQRHFIVQGGTLRLENVVLSGDTANTGDNHGGIYVMGTNARLYMGEGGVIENCRWTVGGGVQVEQNGTFTMNNGSIRHNTAAGTAATNGGGGIYVRQGTFVMTDGEIHHNTASNGGGVHVFGSNLIMHGGTIHNNVSEATGGGHGGGVVARNGSTFVMHNGAIHNNEALGIGSGGGVRLYSNSTFTMHNGQIANNDAGANGGGVSLSISSVFTMHGGAIQDNGHNTTVSGGGVHVSGAGSHFIMEDGYVLENMASTGGGGAVNLISGGVFNMRRGVMSGNQANLGGGVHVMANTNFIMEGGRIVENTSTQDGGGIRIIGTGVFTMQNGEIHDNTAVNGGGVHASAGGTAVMHGGVISDNTSIGPGAGNGGGGVFVVGVGTSFTMNNGKIYNNTATNGGGVHIAATSGFTINNGEITANTSTGTNTATNGGGGVNIVVGTFTMNGGSVAGNISQSNGGGIRRGADANAHLVIANGEIQGNTAAANGGGIHAQGQVYTPVLGAGDYPRIIIGPDVVFSGNRADAGAFRPPNYSAVAGRIEAGSRSIFSHPLNNFDINSRYGAMVSEITITFMTDARGAFDGPGGPAMRLETIDLLGSNAAALPASPQNVPDVTEAADYRFIGWLVYSDLGGQLLTSDDIKTMPVFDNITFIAQYERKTHEVTFILNGGAGDFPPQTIYHGNLAAIPSNTPARQGYTFLGWFTSPVGGYLFNFAMPITADTYIYARWTPNVENGDNNGGTGGGTTGFPPTNQTPGGQPPTNQTSSQQPIYQTPGQHHAYLIGFEDSTIRPMANITRAQAATMLFRLMSDQNRSLFWLQSNPYNDVEITDWFNNAVSTTSNFGLFEGMPDGTFRPHHEITRAELAAAIVRLKGGARRNKTAHTPPNNTIFNDIHNHWAKDYINYAANHNWLYGYPDFEGSLDRQFLPNQPITRAEATAMINHAFRRLPHSKNDLLPQMRTWPDNANPEAWYYLHIQEATNSHHFTMRADSIHETWLQLILPERPWALLELPGSRPEDIGGR